MDINGSVKSQYAAALTMLRQAVVKCPDSLWMDATCGNVFWMVAYHALFYTHFYLHPGMEQFVPWAKARQGAEQFQPGGETCTKEEILEFCEFAGAQVDRLVDAAEMDAPSGFHWLPFSRLEAHMYNLRHLQQHVGELCERLGVRDGVGVDWVIKVRE